MEDGSMKHIEDASARFEDLGSAAVKARLETLHADLAEAEQHLAGIEEEGGQATARGDSDEKRDDLLEQFLRAEARIKFIKRGIREAEETHGITSGMDTAREVAARELALRRAFGGVVSARKKAEEAAAAKMEAAVEAVKTVNDLYADELRFRSEALVLAAAFERPPVDLPRRHRPSTNKEVLKALGKVRAVALSDARELPDRLDALPWEGTYPSVTRLLDRIAGSPTAALIAKAGAGILTAEDWETHRSTARRKSLEQEAKAREAAMATVDNWLRQLLSDGPVPLEGIEREAQREGVTIRPRMDDAMSHASLGAAADRIGIQAVREYPSKVVYWTLPGQEIDSDRFEPLKSAVPMSAARG
jgi:hypothetical protein